MRLHELHKLGKFDWRHTPTTLRWLVKEQAAARDHTVTAAYGGVEEDGLDGHAGMVAEGLVDTVTELVPVAAAECSAFRASTCPSSEGVSTWEPMLSQGEALSDVFHARAVMSADDYERGGRYSRPFGAAARFVESAGVQCDATGEARSTGLAAEYVTVAAGGDMCDVRAPPLPAARVPVAVPAPVSPPGLLVAPATALAPAAAPAPVPRLTPVHQPVMSVDAPALPAPAEPVPAPPAPAPAPYRASHDEPTSATALAPVPVGDAEPTPASAPAPVPVSAVLAESMVPGGVIAGGHIDPASRELILAPAQDAVAARQAAQQQQIDGLIDGQQRLADGLIDGQQRLVQDQQRLADGLIDGQQRLVQAFLGCGTALVLLLLVCAAVLVCVCAALPVARSTLEHVARPVFPWLPAPVLRAPSPWVDAPALLAPPTWVDAHAPLGTREGVSLGDLRMPLPTALQGAIALLCIAATVSRRSLRRLAVGPLGGLVMALVVMFALLGSVHGAPSPGQGVLVRSVALQRPHLHATTQRPGIEGLVGAVDSGPVRLAHSHWMDPGAAAARTAGWELARGACERRRGGPADALHLRGAPPWGMPLWRAD